MQVKLTYIFTCKNVKDKFLSSRIQVPLPGRDDQNRKVMLIQTGESLIKLHNCGESVNCQVSINVYVNKVSNQI